MAAPAVVTIAPRVIMEVTTIARWWRRNRPAAPRLFQTELDDALLLLAEHPESGRRVRARGRPNLRALTLLRSRYVVFYELVPRPLEVIVTRVRHGHRRPLAKHRRAS
jgi:plasmid stabilization system protein ParE